MQGGQCAAAPCVHLYRHPSEGLVGWLHVECITLISYTIGMYIIADVDAKHQHPATSINIHVDGKIRAFSFVCVEASYLPYYNEQFQQ